MKELDLGEPSSEDEGKQDGDELPQIQNHSGVIVVFASDQGVENIRMADELFLDGTFNTAPAPFSQIMFVQAKRNGNRAVPSAFVLLTKKVNVLL